MFVTRTCRPIKVGFVVNPNDASAIRKAIEVNTFLWGGQYNPLIPLYNRKPRHWSDLPFERFDRRTVLQGYLSAFDPDFVVPVGDIKLDRTAMGGRQQLRLEHVLGDVEHHGAPSVGAGLFETLDHFAATELRFVRSRPIRFQLPRISERQDLFLAAVFGSLAGSLARIFDDGYGVHLGVEYVTCGCADYFRLLEPDNLFLRRMTSLFLSPKRYPAWGHETCVFLCDPDKTSDILDYWNLRALGWAVFPLPRKAIAEQPLRDHVARLVERTFAPYRSNPNLYARTTLLKSRHCTKEEAQAFVRSLNLAPTQGPAQPKIVLQGWYPRVWDRRYWQSDDAICCTVEAGQMENEFPDDVDEMLRFSVAPPVCIDDLRRQAGPRSANVVNVRSYSSRTPLAEVIPECDRTMCRAIQSHDGRQWRFSEHGLVFLANYANESVWMGPPDAQRTFLDWMEWQGWEVKPSAPGHLATQLIRSLGGMHGVGLIAQQRLLEMLGKMGGDASLSADEVRATVSRVANERYFSSDPSILMKRLVERGILRLGLRVQCPTCTQRSWYSLAEIDYQVRCPKCEDTFSLPSHSLDEVKWAYRAQGAFGLPHQAHGVYCVLLLARFFSELMRLPTTPVFGFEAKKGTASIEVDLGVLTDYRTMSGYRRTTLFAECKTFNCFRPKDVSRMSVLDRLFNEVILVFATLKDMLTDQERRALLPLATRCRRAMKSKSGANDVLVLTGNELFAHSGPPYCWEEKEGMFKRYAQRHDVARDLEALCRVTQEMYLGLS